MTTSNKSKYINGALVITIGLILTLLETSLLLAQVVPPPRRAKSDPLYNADMRRTIIEKDTSNLSTLGKEINRISRSMTLIDSTINGLNKIILNRRADSALDEAKIEIIRDKVAIIKKLEEYNDFLQNAAIDSITNLRNNKLELESQNKDLVSRIQVSTSSNDSLIRSLRLDSLSSLSSRIDDLNSKIDILQVSLTDGYRKSSETMTRLLTLTDSLSKESKTYRHRIDTLNESRRNLDSLKHILDSLTTQHDIKDAEITTIQREIDSLKKLSNQYIDSLLGKTVFFPLQNAEQATAFYGKDITALQFFKISGWNDRSSIYSEVISTLFGTVRFALGVTIAATTSPNTDTTETSGTQASESTKTPTPALQRFLTSGGNIVTSFAYPIMWSDLVNINWRGILYLVPKFGVDVGDPTKESPIKKWNLDMTAELESGFFSDSGEVGIVLSARGGYVVGSSAYLRSIDWQLARGHSDIEGGFAHLEASIGLDLALQSTHYRLLINIPFNGVSPGFLARYLRPTISFQVIPGK